MRRVLLLLRDEVGHGPVRLVGDERVDFAPDLLGNVRREVELGDLAIVKVADARFVELQNVLVLEKEESRGINMCI